MTEPSLKEKVEAAIREWLAPYQQEYRPPHNRLCDLILSIPELADREALKARLEEAEGVIRFYADEERWREYSADKQAAAFDRNVGSDLGDDEGDKARAFLTPKEPRDE